MCKAILTRKGVGVDHGSAWSAAGCGGSGQCVGGAWEDGEAAVPLTTRAHERYLHAGRRRLRLCRSWRTSAARALLRVALPKLSAPLYIGEEESDACRSAGCAWKATPPTDPNGSARMGNAHECTYYSRLLQESKESKEIGNQGCCGVLWGAI